AYPHIPVVSWDLPALARLAAARFVAAGRRRVAVLLNASLGDDQIEQITTALTAHDLLPDRDLMVGVNIDRGRWVQTVVRLLFDVPAADRPDALFIADDNLIEPATAALAAMGLRAPDDVVVVASSNFPWAPTCHVPIERIGSSVTEMLQT